jgi:hypothetical protein
VLVLGSNSCPKALFFLREVSNTENLIQTFENYQNLLHFNKKNRKRTVLQKYINIVGLTLVFRSQFSAKLILGVKCQNSVVS